MVKKLVFTGGHHTSALEVASALKTKGWEIVWFGHKYSMLQNQTVSGEYTDVTTAGIKFYDLKAGKFFNTFNPLKLLRIPLGFIQALWWLLQERPNGIISFGGYLAVPTVLAGWLLGIKSITHEQTVVAGWANKLIGKFVCKIAVTWPSSISNYPKSKVVLTGLPIAVDLKGSEVQSSKGAKQILLIVGGKQGSHKINEIIFQILPQLVNNWEVWHQTGNSSIYDDLDRARAFKLPNYHPFGYSRDRYLEKLKQATIVIGRAGAHSVYELGILGKPAVLIPISWVSHQEQFRNAQVLEAAGLAVILPEENLSGASLLERLNQAVKFKSHKLNLITDGTSRMIQLIEQEYV